MRTQIVFGVLAALLVLAAPAKAAQAAAPTAAEDAPDPNAQREFSAKMMGCNLCHGTNGVPKMPAIPVIWGQQQDYLTNQLHNFENGNRTQEVMKWMTETLTEEERPAAAAYFSKQKWPAKAAGAAAAPVPRNMVVCQACHLPNFVGGILVPRLAGQSYEYLIEEMRRFASDERKNNADMTQLMKAVSPADRDAMARYLAGL